LLVDAVFIQNVTELVPVQVGYMRIEFLCQMQHRILDVPRICQR